MPWTVKWSVGAFAKSKDYTLQGWDGGMSFFNTSLTKTLFSDKLDVSLMYMTPMTGKLQIKQYSKGDGYENHFKINVPFQMVRLSLTWHFGNTKKQFKKYQSKVNNNFLNDGGEKLPVGNIDM